eukprot:COSAG02_NODE_1900_length_10458_cov_4.285838_8_plen_190_part_00
MDASARDPGSSPGTHPATPRRWSPRPSSTLPDAASSSACPRTHPPSPHLSQTPAQSTARHSRAACLATPLTTKLIKHQIRLGNEPSQSTLATFFAPVPPRPLHNIPCNAMLQYLPPQEDPQQPLTQSQRPPTQSQPTRVSSPTAMASRAPFSGWLHRSNSHRHRPTITFYTVALVLTGHRVCSQAVSQV